MRVTQDGLISHLDDVSIADLLDVRVVGVVVDVTGEVVVAEGVRGFAEVPGAQGP